MKHHYGTSDEDKSLWLISKCSVIAWAPYSLRHVPFFILKPIRFMIQYYRRIIDTVMSFQIRAKSTVKWKRFLKLPKWPSFERTCQPFQWWNINIFRAGLTQSSFFLVLMYVVLADKRTDYSPPQSLRHKWTSTYRGPPPSK